MKKAAALALATISLVACGDLEETANQDSSTSEEAADSTTAGDGSEPEATQPAGDDNPPPEDPETAAAQGAAKGYLDYSGFCRQALIEQLEFEGYSTEAATAAVDSLDVDWLHETVRVAQGYVDYSDFSHDGLVDQLEFEGCEPAHAEQAATQVLGF